MEVLLIMAHADDETLGAGGTVQKLTRQGHQVRLLVVSDGVVAMRDDNSDNREALKNACGILGIDDFQTLDFKDQRFDTYPVAEIANAIGKGMNSPDLIITHSAKDLNADHRIVHEAVKIVARPRSRKINILACEIPFVAAWNQHAFQPQVFVNIAPYLETKIRAFEAYGNELKTFPDPYSSEGIRTIARFRGMESGYEAAEGFEVIRLFDTLIL